MKKQYFSSALILAACTIFAISPELTAAGAGPDDEFLAAVRQQVMSQVSSLPNFICTRERFESAQMGASLDSYTVDESRVEVSFYGNKEHYRPLKEGPQAPEIGVISMGEFGGTLTLIFDPAGSTAFTVKGTQTIRGRKTQRIDFQAPQEGSKLGISMGDRRVIAAYQGSCWADLETRQIVRLQILVPRLPADFHIQKASQLIDYDRVKIGDGMYWLPVSAASETSIIGNAAGARIDLAATIWGFSRPGISWDKAAVKNLIKFKNYRKFEAESRILP